MKTIVCISDLQVPYHDVEAVKAIAKFIKAYQPDTVVLVVMKWICKLLVVGVRELS